MIMARLGSRPAAVVSLLLASVVSAAGAAAQEPTAAPVPAPASLIGSVVDQTSREIVGAALLLTHAQTRVAREIRSGESGRFEFADLPEGEYVFEVRAPGFAAFRSVERLRGVRETAVTLRLGQLQETVTVLGQRTAPGAVAPTLAVPTAGSTATPRLSLADCRADSNVRPPRKVKQVMPAYPAHLGAEGIRGEVVLTGTLTTDGTVQELRASESHPDLVQASIEAVRQWEFDPTLLNCVPVELEIVVTIRFELPE